MLSSVVYTVAMAQTKVLMTAEEFDNYPFEEDKRFENETIRVE